MSERGARELYNAFYYTDDADEFVERIINGNIVTGYNSEQLYEIHRALELMYTMEFVYTRPSTPP